MLWSFSNCIRMLPDAFSELMVFVDEEMMSPESIGDPIGDLGDLRNFHLI